MFSIGDFARHGRVSVRMLRHYDGIGLLRPALVDPSTGYRYYDAAQLPQLNRIVALKELGFGLQQVAGRRPKPPATGSTAWPACCATGTRRADPSRRRTTIPTSGCPR